MKNHFFYIFFTLVFFASILNSCKKDEQDSGSVKSTGSNNALGITIFDGSDYKNGVTEINKENYNKIEGIAISHCTDCGKVLAGSARIDHASIQWVGAESKDMQILLTTGNGFGFTGSFDSTGKPDASLLTYLGILNKWFFVSTSEVAIGEPEVAGKAPKLGFYFAPSSAQLYESNYFYSPSCPSCQQSYTLQT